MTQAPSAPSAPPPGILPRLKAFASALEVDSRLLSMIVAIVLIWVGFHFLSGGKFLEPRNMWNLSVQTASVAVMATGMVLIIVARHIDLSVGSMLGLIGMVMALVSVELIPKTLGFGIDQPWTWVVTVLVGLAIGALLGAVQGGLVAYVGIPSFVVTLGGLLVWRAVTFTLASGRTIAPMDSTFQLLGGGPKGSVGVTVSWIIGAIACIGIAYGIYAARRRRRRYDFPVRPLPIDVGIIVAGCAVVLLAVNHANSYPWPAKLAEQYAIANGIDPVGFTLGTGIANPVLIALGVGVIMTFLATRRRFGRYVYAIGGNPDAAELSGINTKRTIMLTFVLMGVLAAVSSVISTARLNAATNQAGSGDELDVIAAAVIGGTSFAGGIGTIPGAILGALMIQSIRSGMQLIGLDNAPQMIAVGTILVAAVGIDQVLRRRAG